MQGHLLKLYINNYLHKIQQKHFQFESRALYINSFKHYNVMYMYELWKVM